MTETEMKTTLLELVSTECLSRGKSFNRAEFERTLLPELVSMIDGYVDSNKRTTDMELFGERKQVSSNSINPFTDEPGKYEFVVVKHLQPLSYVQRKELERDGVEWLKKTSNYKHRPLVLVGVDSSNLREIILVSKITSYNSEIMIHGYSTKTHMHSVWSGDSKGIILDGDRVVINGLAYEARVDVEQHDGTASKFLVGFKVVNPNVDPISRLSGSALSPRALSNGEGDFITYQSSRMGNDVAISLFDLREHNVLQIVLSLDNVAKGKFVVMNQPATYHDLDF